MPSYPIYNVKTGHRIRVEPISDYQLDGNARDLYFSTEQHRLLQDLYEELQLNSIEAGHPEQDLLTFLLNTSYFGVISLLETYKHEDPLQNSTAANLNSQPNATGYFEDEESIHDAFKTIVSHDRPQSEVDQEWDDYIWNLGTNPNNQSTSSGTRLRSASWRHQPSTNDIMRSVQQQLLQDPQAPPVSRQPPIGFVYLIGTQRAPFPPSTVGEMTIGVILHSAKRGFGYAKEALELVLEEAFNNLHSHRIQANVLDTYSKERVVNLFTQMRFSHEGTRRRSYYSIMEQEWKDVTSFALLDTEWIMRAYFRAAPKTLWDEMLLRHEREREALLRWEHIHLKRTSSTETLRSVQPMTPIGVTSQSEGEASDAHSTKSMLADKGKRKMDAIEDPFASEAGSRASSVSLSDSETEDRLDYSVPSRKLRRVEEPVSDSDIESDAASSYDFGPFSSPSPVVPRSPSPSSSSESEADSEWSAQTGSDWDHLETASASDHEHW
ncbi:hypothetical protein K435DRAFT_742717 [Dendrothele bispora CBS 962.96]|uniref:N-acetyltransferase domain-containing protein n=1 Tax=Dendrothele bispora (strain CBS 962.96) TaxID=1314807 RepID=A0A4V4HIL9_DENBC|nr:hypothetical protein K435DRAFT_742717 [Dendrothele bispora CBS 962.96]